MWSPSVFAFRKSRSQPTRRSTAPSRHRHSFRPCLEALEDRSVPSTLSVTSNADNGAAGTLRWAVAQAKKNDTIAIVTTQTIVLTQGQIALGTDLTIEGANKTPATVSGGFTSDIFVVNASVTLQNLDLIDGKSSGPEGGAILVEVANLTVNNCSFSGNASNISAVPIDDEGGGAIADAGGNLTVDNCSFSGNAASYGGAIAAYWVSGGPFTTNRPVVSITNSTFSGNTATHGGAISDNSGSAFGTKKTPQMSISGCSFSGNSATDGGAVFLDTATGSVTIISSSFVNNSASQAGGAIYSFAVLTVTLDTFSENTPDSIYGSYQDGGGNIGL
jgi:predicted outer membrane repeat protein